MAENQDESQKTEQPTAKKLRDARKRGQVAQSKEVNSWAVLLAATLITLGLSPWMAGEMGAQLAVFIARPHELPTDGAGLGRLLAELMIAQAPILLLPFGLILLAGVSAGLAQTGFIVSTEPIQPKLSKINPIEGFKRLFSLKNLIEFLKGLVKLTVVTALAVMVMMPEVDRLDRLPSLPMSELLWLLYELTLRLMATVLLAVTLIAVIDYAYQRYDHVKKLRMTKQEIKDEYKQTEGDPLIKARLRQLRMEKARRRMMQQVPKADVVITNPTHFAVALRYDAEKSQAPVVVAKGQDLIAQKIRELAAEHRVPLVANPPLARALHQAVEIDEEIRPEHYKAVAEIISYVYSLKRPQPAPAAGPRRA